MTLRTSSSVPTTPSPSEGVRSGAATEDGPEDFLASRGVALGSPEALDVLISRYWKPLLIYASRYLDDDALAEDAVQSAFIRLWQDRAGPRPRSVRAYLFRVVRNLALDEIRSRAARQRREARSAAESPRLGPTPEQLLEEDALARVVDREIQRLPARRREAFVLAYLHRFSYAEVATIMEVSPKTVGHHLSAALAELRERLSPLLPDLLPPPR